MPFVDLHLRCETHGITLKRLATLLGRSYPTVVRWASTRLEQPPWLADWLEYMDMELIRGNVPERLPRRVKDVHALLYPSRQAAEAATKRPRRPNGCLTIEQERRHAARVERWRRQMGLEKRKEERRAMRENRHNLLRMAAESRAIRRCRRNNS